MKRNTILILIFIVIHFLSYRVIDSKIDILYQEILAVDSYIHTIDEQLYSKADRTEIDTILDELEGYTQKVDNLTLNYMSLDEVLKQMFGEKQARYMRGLAK